MSLTAIGKIFNGITYDFPIEACVKSYLEAADEFHLVVCEDSEDDTVDYCRQLAKEEPRLKLIYDKWRISPNENYKNMARLANRAIDGVTTDWFISVDMDEIMPSSSAARMRHKLGHITKDVGVLLLKFHHLYYDLGHEILGKLYPQIHRIARNGNGWESGSDGCGLGGGKGAEKIADFETCHYGYLREYQVALQKETRFQQELYHEGVPGLPDCRLIEYSKDPPKSTREFWESFVSTNDSVVSYRGPEHHLLARTKYGENK